MKRSVQLLAFLAVVAVLGAHQALASGDLITWVTGTGVQTTTVGLGAKLLVQCPDETVQYRALGVNDVHDGGQRNVTMNFVLNPDPFPVQLRLYESRLSLLNVDGGALGCGIYSNSP